MSPYTHPEYLALLAAVRASPADDLPRLVAADWLDEHGEIERAEFIRLQCELARVPPEPEKTKCSGTMVESPQAARLHTASCEWCQWVVNHRDPSEPLRGRQLALWNGRHDHWFEALNGLRPMLDTPPPGYWLIVRRGFVAEVRCHMTDWIGGECGRCDPSRRQSGAYSSCPACSDTGHTFAAGPAVVAAHPIERVVVMDREPLANNWRWMWHPGPRAGLQHQLPNEIFQLLNGGDIDPLAGHRAFTARLGGQGALVALSAALLAWALAQLDSST